MGVTSVAARLKDGRGGAARSLTVAVRRRGDNSLQGGGGRRSRLGGEELRGLAADEVVLVMEGTPETHRFIEPMLGLLLIACSAPMFGEQLPGVCEWNDGSQVLGIPRIEFG